MRRRDQIAALAVLATVFVAVFLIGSSTRWTAICSAVLGLSCSAIYIRSRRRFTEAPPLVLLLGAAAALTAFQLVPLPFALLEILSPAKAMLLAANASAIGEATPSFGAISMEPPLTWLALASLVGYLSVAAVAIRVGNSSAGRKLLCQGLVAIATAVAAVAVVHQVGSLNTLFGVYDPEQTRGIHRFLSPLINPNHLAGFLATATPLAAGLFIGATGPRRLLWLGCAVLCAAVSLLVQSRTGVISLSVGLLVFAGLYWPTRKGIRRKRRHGRRRGNRENQIALVIIGAVFVVGAAFFLGRGAVSELASTQTDELTGQRGKVAAWQSSTALLWNHKLVGTGRGAFEQAFSSRIHESRFQYSHVENEYLQALIDWGIPGALFLFYLLLIAVRVAARHRSSSVIAAGLSGGLVASAIHHVADFGLELPGPALFTVVIFAALSRTDLSLIKSADSTTAGLQWRNGRELGLVVVGALIMFAVATPLSRTRGADAKRLTKAASMKPASKLVDIAIANWKQHPADFIAAGQAAEILWRARDNRAFRVINRALHFHPLSSQLHQTAARMLLNSERPQQALGEYRQAIKHALRPGPVIVELTSRYSTPTDIAAGIPRGNAKRVPAYLLALGGGTSASREAALLYAAAMTEAFPNNGRIGLEYARIALGQNVLDVAIDAAINALKQGERRAAAIAGRALILKREPKKVLDLFVSLEKSGPVGRLTGTERLAELRVHSKAYEHLGYNNQAAAVLKRALRISSISEKARTQLQRQIDDIESREPDPN